MLGSQIYTNCFRQELGKTSKLSETSKTTKMSKTSEMSKLKLILLAYYIFDREIIHIFDFKNFINFQDIVI